MDLHLVKEWASVLTKKYSFHFVNCIYPERFTDLSILQLSIEMENIAKQETLIILSLIFYRKYTMIKIK